MSQEGLTPGSVLWACLLITRASSAISMLDGIVLTSCLGRSISWGDILGLLWASFSETAHGFALLDERVVVQELHACTVLIAEYVSLMLVDPHKHYGYSGFEYGIANTNGVQDTAATSSSLRKLVSKDERVVRQSSTLRTHLLRWLVESHFHVQ